VHTHVAEHPLIGAKLTALRDGATDGIAFRTLVDELVVLLAFEATRGLRVVPRDVVTPLAVAHGTALAEPPPLIVPILRAGLGMLPGMMRVLPQAEVGFVGMARDETTHLPTTYAERLPLDITGRQCLVLDPMLATGGSLVATVELLLARGVDEVVAVCLLAAPEGLAHVQARFAGDDAVSVVVAAVDDHLNDDRFIVPGLGDAGDRLFGTV